MLHSLFVRVYEAGRLILDVIFLQRTIDVVHDVLVDLHCGLLSQHALILKA